MNKPKIVVVGSINMDLVTETSTFPSLGETHVGNKFMMLPGGKGANQAVACSRLGADVTLIGCIGDDDLGSRMLKNLKKENVNTTYVETMNGMNTGTASITIEDGENRIIYVPGANEALTPEKLEQVESVIQKADVLLLQLETPLETVAAATTIAKRYKVPVILNPAPAVQIPEKLIEDIDFLTPNEHELAIALGYSDNELFVQKTLAEYPGKIIMTKGKEGAYYTNSSGVLKNQPTFLAETVDTTGAGDTFNAGIAVMVGERQDLNTAVRFATAAGTLSVTKSGAQGGMPHRGVVDHWLTEN
ncbi:ribokinase [Marinococcus halophilus]|nr:ribokinase [Marinococcus halophilus]OZT79111.1 ribokinase [Marinococcus halophilus]